MMSKLVERWYGPWMIAKNYVSCRILGGGFVSIDQCSFPICVLKAPVLISNLLRCGILLVLSSYVGKLKNMVIQDIKSSK